MSDSEPASYIGEMARYAGYLRILAEMQVSREMRGKIDLSGLIQQTLFEASKTPQLGHETAERQRAWMRVSLTNNLRDEIRKLTRDKRDVRREISLQDMEDSSLRLDAILAGSNSAPDAHAIYTERLLAVTQAMSELPEMQRAAILLQQLQGLPVAEVAEQLGKSPVAVAGLLKRGFKTLREKLNGHDGSI